MSLDTLEFDRDRQSVVLFHLIREHIYFNPLTRGRSRYRTVHYDPASGVCYCAYYYASGQCSTQPPDVLCLDAAVALILGTPTEHWRLLPPRIRTFAQKPRRVCRRHSPVSCCASNDCFH